MSYVSKKAAHYAANTLPLFRVAYSFQVAKELRTTMHDPKDRTWAFAGRVLTAALSDTVDGILARYAGPTRLGGYLDQLADKVAYLVITRQLAKNGEIPLRVKTKERRVGNFVAIPALEKEYKYGHFTVALARDVVATTARGFANRYGLKTDADQLGKIKAGVQAAAIVAACSPLSYEHPEVVEGLYGAATMMSVVSGADMLVGYGKDIHHTHQANLKLVPQPIIPPDSPNPAFDFVTASVESLAA